MVFGCVLRDGRDSSERLRRLIHPFSARGPDGTTVWARRPTALAVASLITSPGRSDSGLAIVDDENVVVVLDGRINNVEALRRELDLPPDTLNSETVARGYARWSVSLFDRLVGEFAVLIWDRKASALFAVRDALATRPLCYWADGAVLAVSSDVESFLNCREFERTPDDDMVVDYLLGRFRDPDRTFFKRARQVPGGHYLVATAKGTDLRRYWYPPRRELDSMSTPESDHRFRELFEQSVRRRLVANTPILIHVSGGLDSTSIFSAAMRFPAAQAIRGVAAVHPGLDCDESRYVAEVSAAVGVPIETWDGTTSEPLDLLDPALAAPGIRAVLSGGTLGDFEIARREGSRVILNGTGGDQLGTPSGVLQQMFASGAWVRALRWTLGFPGIGPRARLGRLGFGARGLAPASLRHLWRRRSRPLPAWLSQNLVAAVDTSSGPRRDLRFSSIVQRRHWETLTSSHLNVSVAYLQRQATVNDIEVRFPFLDKELVDFVLSMPFQNWPAPDSNERLHRRALAGLLPPVTRTRRSKAEFSTAFALRVRQNRGTILRLFARDSEWASARYLDRRKTLEIVESAAGASGTEPSQGPMVWRLATVEAWLQGILGYSPA